MDVRNTVSAERPERGGEIAFDRSLAGLTAIAVQGLLLSLVTGGLYRFWYMTKLRRFFWSRTLVDGSPAAYTGSGDELFFGFLVAIVILLPLQLSILVATLSVNAFAPYVDVLSFAALFLLSQFALYRGRRYRASRTAWRGIRLRQDGSALGYMTLASGWWILTLATLGLAYPFMRANLERYRIRHTLVGTSRMKSEACGSVLLGSWLLLYIIAVLAMVVTLFILYLSQRCALPLERFEHPNSTLISAVYKILLDGKERCVPATSRIIKAIYITFFAGFFAFIFISPYYTAREIRNFMSAIRLKDAHMQSRLKVRDFYRPYIYYVNQIMKISIRMEIYFAILCMVMLVARDEIPQTIRQMLVGLSVIASLLWVTIDSALAYVRVFSAERWRVIAESTHVLGMNTVVDIMATPRADSGRSNEGMADALDVGGTLQIEF